MIHVHAEVAKNTRNVAENKKNHLFFVKKQQKQAFFSKKPVFFTQKSLFYALLSLDIFTYCKYYIIRGIIDTERIAMFKPFTYIIAIFAFYALSVPYQAYAGTTKGNDTAATQDGETAPVPDVALPATSAEDNKDLLPDISKMSDSEIFESKLFDLLLDADPSRVAEAIVNILDKTDVGKLDKFQDEHPEKISKTIAYYKAARQQGPFDDRHYRIVKGFGRYGLFKPEEGDSQDMRSIDSLPVRPGYSPRPPLPMPAVPVSISDPKDNVQTGSPAKDDITGSTSAAKPQKPSHGHPDNNSILVPPKPGTSAQVITNGGKPVELNPILTLVPAYTAAKKGNKKAFHEAVEKAEEYFPTKQKMQLAAASLYFDAGDYKGSERAATRAIGLSKNDPNAYKTRAMARSALNNRKGAIEDVNKAVEINPQDESARLLSLLIESRKPEKSVKTVASINEIRRQFGLKTQIRDAASDTAADLSGKAKSMNIPDSSITTDYAKSKNFSKTAQAKNRMKDYDGAISYATLAIEKDATNIDAYLERAAASYAMGKYDDTIRDTTYIIENDKTNTHALNLRASALNQSGKAAEAAADADTALDINPNYAEAWFNHGVAAEKQGDYKQMLEDYKQAAALNDNYSRKYQDALAQYGARVPGFSAEVQTTQAADLGSEVQDNSVGPMGHYIMLLVFMLVGGTFIAVGLAHLLSGQNGRGHDKHNATQGGNVQKGSLPPSVFYEGVATGKYKIEKKIGEGAMGKVYLAVDKSLGRKVAIKKMNEEIKMDEREKQRFLEEARTVALLHHPNIVEIYTIFEENEDVFLVFEYLEGRTLDTVLSKDIRMSFNRVKSIYEEVAKALEYAHGKGVVHRDLKLSNIMLTAEGYVKVTDFGLSGRAIEAKVNSGNKEIVGSPAYMAPEQEKGESSVRSDIYSLGVCIYESLTGILPFHGPDFYSEKERSFYEPVSHCVPGLPKSIDSLIEKCLAFEPEKRFASAKDFRKALDEIHI